jgi:CSLREA domain-containing protein
MRTRLLIAGPLALIASLLFAASAIAGIQLTVTTTADDAALTNDDGLCTLREAVNASNGNTVNDCPSSGAPSVNQIGFAAGLGGNPVIDLTAFGSLQFGANPVTITGPATVNGASHFRVMTSNASSLTLNSLTISNGSEDTQGLGGGIEQIGGQLFLNNSTVSGNTTTQQGANVSAFGGGIYSTGNVNLTNSAVTGNQAIATCTSCNSVSGSALSLGGGVEAQGADLDVENSVVSGNKATSSADNARSAEADGGGLRNAGGVLIQHSTISGNQISATSTTGNGQAIVQGGGLLFHATTAVNLDIELSTIANNLEKAVGTSPILRGGGVSDGAKNTPSNYVSDTIAGNGLDPASATSGVEGLNFESQTIGTGSRTFNNTIIANPVGSVGSNCAGGTPYATSGAPNDDFPLDTPNACFAAGMGIMNSDPLLGALGPNGGSTPTMVPSASSPVIDQGDASDQNDLTQDQRGLTRPVAFSGLTHPFDGSDIGAVEVQQACSGFTQPTPTTACPTPPSPPAQQPTAPAKKKCKKAKKGASAAKKKKCKKRKK